MINERERDENWRKERERRKEGKKKKKTKKKKNCVSSFLTRDLPPVHCRMLLMVVVVVALRCSSGTYLFLQREQRRRRWWRRWRWRSFQYLYFCSMDVATALAWLEFGNDVQSGGGGSAL